MLSSDQEWPFSPSPPVWSWRQVYSYCEMETLGYHSLTLPIHILGLIASAPLLCLHNKVSRYNLAYMIYKYLTVSKFASGCKFCFIITLRKIIATIFMPFYLNMFVCIYRHSILWSLQLHQEVAIWIFIYKENNQISNM